MSNDVIDRLPGDLREVAEIIGVDNTMALVDRFGGTYIRVPKCEGLLRSIRDNKIRKLYDSGRHDVRALALKFRLTDRTVSEILKGSEDKMLPQLLSLFDKR
ncbi:MAG: DNA-binding protein [Deltaproteobacteria bacterium]|nr:DNA-binding protein [Deltaproteobacteria bacterium]